MKTTIIVDDPTLEGIRNHNETHPERQINISAVCRRALGKALNDARA